MEDRWVAWLKLALVALFTAFAISFAILTIKGAGQAGTASPEPGNVASPSGAYPSRVTLSGLARELADLEVIPLRPSWELSVGSGQIALSLDGGRLYVASSTDSAGSSLYCVDARTGEVLWSRFLDAWISCAPRAWEDKLYVGTASHVLYAFDARGGALLWSFTAQGEILTTPTVDGDTLLFFADNNAVFGLSNRLYALDSRNGSLRWLYETASWTPSPPAVAHGMVFTAGSMSTVIALDKNSGREVWVRSVESVVFSSPLLGGENLYVATVNGHLYALEALTGERRWEVDMHDFTPSLPRLSGEVILLDRCPDRLLAFSVADGHVAWSLGSNALLADMQARDLRTVFAFYPRGRLLELASSTGRCLRVYSCGFDLAQRPLVSGGLVYCVSSDGKVRACPLSGDATLSLQAGALEQP